MKLAAISVDLDEIPCYSAIHGLATAAGSEHALYDRAIPRMVGVFDELRLRSTLFAIGADLEREANRRRIAQLARAGHEIANHSFSHFYDLTRRDRDTVRREIARGGDAIEAATGKRPVGFRAPGYTITDSVFEALLEANYRYDSSVFPCPGYYGPKALAIRMISLLGRRSRSIVDDPRVLLAPADPYRAGKPYWRRGQGLLEFPIGVTRGLRLPYIGTSVVMSGELGSALLTRLIAGRAFVNLELHAIDFADADSDDLAWLRPHQPDLRRSAEEKIRAFRTAVEVLRGAGYELVTLEEAASRFATL